MEVVIELLQPEDIEDFKDLLSVFDIVFEYAPYTRPTDEHLKTLLNNNSFKVIVAKKDNNIIGGLTAYSLNQYHSTQPILYVQDLAVLTQHQRKGVGRKLIEFTNSYCRDEDFQLMFIQAEKVDDYAVEFYRSTKPTEELEVVYFSYSTKAQHL